MNCEYCQQEHDGSFGSGRFCSRKCSSGFSTRAKRSEINLSVSKKLSERQLSDEHKASISKNWHKVLRNKRTATPIKELLVVDSSFAPLYIRKRLLQEGLKTNQCEECGITDYMGKPLVMQCHHVNGKRSDNRIENLQMLCPNCHSQTENWSGRNRSLGSSTG